MGICAMLQYVFCRRPSGSVTTCKPRDPPSSSSHLPPLQPSTAPQHSPSALTDVCQTSPSVVNAPSHQHIQVYILCIIHYIYSAHTFQVNCMVHFSNRCHPTRPHPMTPPTSWGDHTLMGGANLTTQSHTAQ